MNLNEAADKFTTQPSLGGFNSTTHYLAANFEVDQTDNKTLDWTRNAVTLTNKFVSEDKTKYYPRKGSKSVSKTQPGVDEYLQN